MYIRMFVVLGAARKGAHTLKVKLCSLCVWEKGGGALKTELNVLW